MYQGYPGVIKLKKINIYYICKAPKTKYKNKGESHMLNVIKKYAPMGIFSLVLLLIGQAMEGVLNTISTSKISEIFGQLDTGVKTNTIILYLSVSVGGVIVNRAITYYSASIRETMTTKLRCDYFDKLLRLSTSHLQEISIGDVSTSGTTIPDTVNNVMWLPQLVLSTVVSFIAAMVVFIKTDWVLTLLITVPVLVLGIPFVAVYLKIKPLAKDKRHIDGQVSDQYQRIRCYTVIKGFAKQVFEHGTFCDTQNKFETVSRKKRGLNIIMGNYISILYTIVEIVVIVYCIVTEQSPSKGILFWGLMSKIIHPITNIPEMMEVSSTAKARLDKINSIMNLEDEPDGTITLDTFDDSIEFRNVSFSYDGTSDTLRNINLSIKKGEKIGIYGPSGSGKSTFVNLITRFFSATEGEILVDGVNINSLTANSLRKKVGLVSQNIYLFSNRSIKENIIYGNPHATEADMIEAAKKANAHDFIMSFPDGYDSVVGNDGVKLSGGEQQRISIARLFLSKPDIIILDEATSKLDNESEAKVQEAIDRLGEDKTVIAIAHRLTTIRNCDKLIGISNHTVCESGTVQELLSDRNSLFSRLSNI